MQWRYANRDMRWKKKKKKKKKTTTTKTQKICVQHLKIVIFLQKQIHSRNYAVVNYFQSRRRHINQWKKQQKKNNKDL